MQRKLLGIAVAAALAPAAAFAQPAGTGVQLYGALDFSVNHHKYDGDSTGANVSKGQLYSNSGRVGLRGRESLGSNLNAWFQAEVGVTPFRPEPNSAGNGAGFWGGRDTALGLEGGWGTVALGNWGSPYKVANLATWNLGTYGLVSHYGIIMNNGDSTGVEPSPFCSNNNTGAQICGNGVMAEASTTAFGRRLSNSVQYWTPVFGGFQGRIATQMTGHKSPSGTVGGTDPMLLAASLGWTSGAITLGAAWEQHDEWRGAGAKDTAWMIGGKWTSGPFSIGAAMEQLEYDPSSGTAADGFERRNWIINGAFRVGAGEIYAGYSWTPGNDNCGATLAATFTAAGTDCESGTEAKMFSLGYAHSLSKRTKAYVQFVNIDNASFTGGGTAYNFIAAPPGNDAGGTGGIRAGTDQRVIGVGVQHSF